MLTLGLDVGGTKIAAVILDRTGTVLHCETTSTPSDGAAVIKRIAELTTTALGTWELQGVGVAIPGDVNPATGVIVCAPNIGWYNVDLRACLSDVLPSTMTLTVDNDANAAAWAEYRFGGHTPTDSFAMITVGTGLGGGLVINGRLLRGTTGAAGEIGHLPLVPGGEFCACGSQGCWERYASGSALRRAAANAGWPGPHASHAVLDAAGRNPAARSVVRGIADHLAHGIELVTSALNPATVYLGGGLGTDPRFLTIAQEAMAARGITPPRARPLLKSALLGPLAGAIGAADLGSKKG